MESELQKRAGDSDAGDEARMPSTPSYEPNHPQGKLLRICIERLEEIPGVMWVSMREEEPMSALFLKWAGTNENPSDYLFRAKDRWLNWMDTPKSLGMVDKSQVFVMNAPDDRWYHAKRETKSYGYSVAGSHGDYYGLEFEPVLNPEGDESD